MKRHALLLVALAASVACANNPLRIPHGTAGGDGAAGSATSPEGGAGAPGITNAGGAEGGIDVGVGVDVGTEPDADAGVDMRSEAPDASADVRADASDAVPSPDADGGSLATCPAISYDGGASTLATCLFTTSPTPYCGVTTGVIATSALCAGETTCPVILSAQLGCGVISFAYSEISLAPRADGAAILLDVGVNDGSGQIDGQLFTIASGGVGRVENFPSLTDGTIATDRTGVTNFFDNSATGGWRFQQTAAGWVRESFTPDPPEEFPEIAAGRAIDAPHAFSVLNLGGAIQLATRDTTGWRFTPIAGVTVDETAVSMDLDAEGRPWLATVGNHGDPNAGFVDVVSPAADIDTVGTFDALFQWRTPVVLAGGLAGTDARPAVAFLQADGIHVATPGVVSGWSQRVVPGSATDAVDTTACPDELGAVSGAICERGSCDEHSKGAGQGLGFVRTASGAAFVAWLENDATDTYALVSPQGACGQPCSCERGSLMARAGSSTLMIARLPVDPGTAPTVQSFHFTDTPDGAGTVAMSTRGDTLLVAAVVNVDGTPLDVRYLEIDSAKLP